MRTIKITMELVLKDYEGHDWSANDWIYTTIEEQLESHEFINSYEVEKLEDYPMEVTA